MKTLRIGSRGAVVKSLQQWFATEETLLVDGIFGPKTAQITKKYQKRFGLVADGIVGPRTTARFMQEGWLPAGFYEPRDTSSPYPLVPTSYRYLSQSKKVRKFGSPGTAPANPRPGGPIRRNPTFSKSIVRLNLREWFPHVTGVTALDLNKKVELQWRAFFDAIVETGHAGRILSCAGSWNPRFVRGSTTVFSSHAFATAVDFNAPQNWLRAEPARADERGTLVDVIPLASEYEIWWGGWFRRVDGMHFESTATDEELGLEAG